MSTNEIQGMLARLLATENLTVEHRQVATASFGLDDRVLTLPMWDNVTTSVYSMLVAHEVGHALYTPLRRWSTEERYRDLSPAYVNIVEDTRIEKMMKKRYPGVSRDFYHGYRDMHEKDFFEVNDKDITYYSFIDRINLYFKIGAFIDVEFSDDEADVVTHISNCETHEQMLDLALIVWQMDKKNNSESMSPVDGSQQSGGTDDGDKEWFTDSNPDDDQRNDRKQEDADLDTPSYDMNEDSDEGGDVDSEDEPLESKTQKAYDKKLKDLSNDNASRPTYMTLPNVYLDKVIIPVGKVRQDLEQHFERCMNFTDDDSYENRTCRDTIFESKEKYKEFKTSARAGVNSLVKEFEMKKSASAYARTSTARTGVLDTSKLHTYKYSEDIFRKVSVTTDGKNHSLIFVLDWSGSMQNQILSTIKQLFQLLWFCKKVNIPFEVYAFTNEAWRTDNNPEQHENCEWREKDLYIGKEFRMVNLISSNLKTNDFEKQLEYVWLTASSFVYWIHVPFGYGLSGTPINEAIACVGQIAKQYQRQTKTEKCNVVFLTDGEGNMSGMNVIRMGYDDIERRAATSIRWNTIIRHKSHTFNVNGMGSEFTNTLLRAIKVDNPQCNIMAFRLFSPNDLVSLHRNYGSEAYESYDDMRQELRKHGSVSFRTTGFDRWFGIPGKSLVSSEDLEVDEGAKKSDVSKAFRKMHSGKRSNKYITKAFIEQIA
jgi:hypothetical protein